MIKFTKSSYKIIDLNFGLFVLLFLTCSFPLSAAYFFKNINSDQGLSSNSINAICRDINGYLWIGTDYGLNKYDGYNVKVFKQDINDYNSLKDNYISKIIQDSEGILWIYTSAGYTAMDCQTERFYSNCAAILNKRNIHSNKLLNVICGKYITAHFVDNSNVAIYNHLSKTTVYVNKKEKNIIYQSGSFDFADNLWLIDDHCVLYKINSRNGNIVSVYRGLFQPNRAEATNLFIDKRGNLWITINSAHLYCFNVLRGDCYDFKKNQPTAAVSLFPIRCISEDNNRKVWVGTDHGGISVIDAFTFSITEVNESKKQEYSLADNSVTALCFDSDGITWVGTFKHGLDYYHPSNRRFATSKIPDISENDINCFTEDVQGNLLIGTNGQGLFKYNKKTNKYSRLNYVSFNKQNQVVISLFCDSRGRIWIGTFMDGLYCYDGQHYEHYFSGTSSKYNSQGLSVWSIMEGADHSIWIGTLSYGLFKLDETKHRIISVKEMCRRHLTVECAYKSLKNELYFGTSSGIYQLSPKSDYFNIIEFYRKNKRDSYENYINCIAEDQNGFLWIATQGGLVIRKGMNYHFFGKEEGLDNIFVYRVIVDSHNQIWISTSLGIYLIKVLNYGTLHDIKTRIVHFTKNDGLQDNKFNKAAFITKDNKIIFGGVNGYNVIDPENLHFENKVAKLVFNNLYINNKLISVGEKLSNRVVLKKSLDFTSKIILRHNENTFSISFSALDFLRTKKYTYEYQLKGFDDSWISIGDDNPVVTYNKLSSGSYTFNVRIKDVGIELNQKYTSLSIEILPPFWLSWPAYILYFVILVALFVFIYRYLIDRAILKLQIEKEIEEKKHIEEASLMRVNFFTNLSHEIRTPVSLIISPVENMLTMNLDPSLKNKLTMVLRNAKRLLFIVNQLLDFRKIEMGEITFHSELGNIVKFIHDVTLSFRDLAQNKQIKLSVRSNIEELYTTFDPNKMERILFNLLSNAFKFTGNHGTIDVSIIYDQTRSLPIIIKISDTGIGIDKDKLPYIFKPFYQANIHSSVANIGTGIGLSITYEFVQLHNGKISVQSEINKGSVFTIELPVLEKITPLDVKSELSEVEILNDNSKSVSTHYRKKNKTILIVDDNDDFRFYLVENLRGLYNVIEANNGLIAYEKANRFSPDIIVSDVTMPEMDGFELCEKLKTEVNTSHIPIILLTANTLDKHKIIGFEAGADEYITKPFNVAVLQARISNLLLKKAEQRKLINEHTGSDISDVHLISLDEKLLEKVIKITNDKMADTDFGVDELSKTVGMSSVYLNKKISALTGKTTSEYVRTMRLKRAAQLLEKSDLTISEVAYEVGYNSPKYFSKYFKDEFGILPSEYRKNYI